MAHECRTCRGARKVICFRCGGDKRLNNGKDKCYYCQGSGWIVCPGCDGKGIVEDD